MFLPTCYLSQGLADGEVGPPRWNSNGFSPCHPSGAGLFFYAGDSLKMAQASCLADELDTAHTVVPSGQSTNRVIAKRARLARAELNAIRLVIPTAPAGGTAWRAMLIAPPVSFDTLMFPLKV